MKKKVFIELDQDQDRDQDSSSSISVNSRIRSRIKIFNENIVDSEDNYQDGITVEKPGEKKEATESVTR